ncbi:MAG: class IV adenylate cyclase [Desulfosarcina sp.]|nr:class IV adenylate cyclase [Desulfobacterales bacterium]
MPLDQVEIEVKFYLDDRAVLRSRLIDQGAASQGEVFETNYRYDDQAGHLLAAHCLLRLRQDRRTRLTFKRPRPDGNEDYKVYDEFEVVVEDFGCMHQILSAIGFQHAQIYEKKREVFRLKDALICVDQLPYGDFVEIEGQPEAIRGAAHRLQLPWEKRILTNYLHIFEALRKPLDLGFKDLTFENFGGVPDKAESIIRRFEANGLTQK